MSGKNFAETKSQIDSVGFGKWLTRTRESHGLSKQDLADRCAIQRTTLGHLERGNRPENYAPAVELFVKLAHGLDVELAYVLNRAGYDIGAGGPNLRRLERVEAVLSILDERAPDVRRALAEAMEYVMDGEVSRRIGRALGALDLVTERLREDRQ